MDLNREKMLKEVMAADFYLIELQLYLDTHPTDQRAIMLFNAGVQRAKMIRFQFEQLYGPLCALTSFSDYPWQWIDNPWPWDRQ